MDDPRYGTEPPENIPVLHGDGSVGRLLAGELKGERVEGLDSYIIPIFDDGCVGRLLAGVLNCREGDCNRFLF